MKKTKTTGHFQWGNCAICILSAAILLLFTAFIPFNRTGRSKLPLATEENVKAHFESMLRDPGMMNLQGKTTLLKNDMGRYMREHFLLFDYQKKYFDNTLTAAEVKSSGKANYYHSPNHQTGWANFWERAYQLELQRRKSPDKLNLMAHVTPRFNEHALDGSGSLPIYEDLKLNEELHASITICFSFPLVTICVTYTEDDSDKKS